MLPAFSSSKSIWDNIDTMPYITELSDINDNLQPPDNSSPLPNNIVS